MVDPDLVAQQFLHADRQRNGSSGSTLPSHTEDSLTWSSGIVPGAIAAALFIAFVLVLYTVLWKCMVSPPQRRKSTMRVRVQQRSSV
ncbi:uncharacterized protein sb:cb288 [Brachionichthys hirsutus]|uniref:uncharacterized protein sb:cb288 n=1 Tax=Brachionichthys hirsutus TaxID=412623 RepID=UPI00360492A3